MQYRVTKTWLGNWRVYEDRLWIATFLVQVDARQFVRMLRGER